MEYQSSIEDIAADPLPLGVSSIPPDSPAQKNFQYTIYFSKKIVDFSVKYNVRTTTSYQVVYRL